MNEFKIKSFEFASSLTRQLITLSSIIITVTATFIERFEAAFSSIILIIGWVILFFSILVGIIALMGLTGSMGKLSDGEDVNIYDNNIKRPSMLQILLFIMGMIFIIIYSSSLQLKNDNKTIEKPKEEIKVIKEVKYKILNNSITDTLTAK